MRFIAETHTVAAYRLAPDAPIGAARRKQGGQFIEGLRIISAAGRTVFQHPAAVQTHDEVD